MVIHSNFTAKPIHLTGPFFRMLSLKWTREAKYAKNHFQRNRYSVFESHVMREMAISTKILWWNGYSDVVLVIVCWTATCRA